MPQLEGVAGAEVALGGIGVIYAALNEASTVGALGFIAGSYALITLLLLVLFGRVGPVVLTLSTVGLGAVWIMGFYGLFGRDINMVTMVMPTMFPIFSMSPRIPSTFSSIFRVARTACSCRLFS